MNIKIITQKMEEKNRINADVKQVLFGSLMGDAHLSKPTKNASYICTHCPAQKEYLLWKAGILKKEFRVRVALYNKDINYKAYVVQTNCSPVLTALHRLFYVPFKKPGRKWRKIVSIEMLNQLNSLGIAVWYGDDGTYNVRDKACSLSTQGFTYKENLLIKRYFLERWEINATITADHNKEYNKTYYRVDFRALEAKKFLFLIKDNLPKSMVYKLGHYAKENEEMMLQKDLRYNEIAKKWYYDNHERALGRASRYRNNNREFINRKRVDYYWENPENSREIGRETMRKRRLFKKDEVNLINHNYYHRNRERIRAALKKRLLDDPKFRARKNKSQMESYYKRKLKEKQEVV